VTHIYTAVSQPATDYVDRCGPVEFRGGFLPDDHIAVGCCGRTRLARDVVVQCYYDGPRFWCAEGKGCKSADEIEAKRAKEFANRSAGQIARRARERAP
jgi:hypothetical protein